MREKIEKHIDYPDILRFLHYKKKEVEPQIQEQVNKAVDIVFENAQFLNTMVKLKITYKDDKEVVFDDKYRFESKSLAKLFKNSENVFIVACTIGHNIPRMIKRELVANPSFAVMLDSSASCVADAYAGYLQETLGHTTSRFSPGYGDVALETQQIFAKILDMTKKIGIHLTNGNLMIPEKSVVFLAGDLPQEEQKDLGQSCNTCPRDCDFRVNNK